MEANDKDGASSDYEGIAGVAKTANGNDHEGNFAQGVGNDIHPNDADHNGKVDEWVNNDSRSIAHDRKMKVEKGDNNNCGAVFEKPAKRTRMCLLPSTRPSKGQNKDLVLSEHKRRLIRLLRQLVREHNWKQASGVVSALLKGTEKSPPLVQRRKYWAWKGLLFAAEGFHGNLARDQHLGQSQYGFEMEILATMEALSRMKGLANNERKIKSLYESWMTRRGSKCLKKKYMIQLEYTVFCCMKGDILDAHNNVKCLIQDSGSGSDPVVKLMAGLMCYQLWYSGIPKVMQLNSLTSLSLETCGVSQGDGFCPKAEPFNFTNDCKSIQFQDMKVPLQHDSESIGNKGKSPMDVDGDVLPKQSQEVFPKLKFYQRVSHENSHPQATHNQNNFIIDGDMSFPYASSRIENWRTEMRCLIFLACTNQGHEQFSGLDVSLLPICWQQSTEDADNYHDYLDKSTSRGNYDDAVRHLKDVLYSTPSSMAALLPLTQLLLLNDQAEEALEVLKNYCDKSNAVLPFRLRAKILECFGGKYHAMLPTCYEDTLKKDPRCVSSLSGLIRLYKIGIYNVELLVGMIALHLDATYATCDIWGEFASCFLELEALTRFPYEDDQMSTNREMDDDNSMQMRFSPNRIPKLFAKAQEIKMWRLRCRWWATRHFSKNACLLEKQAGDWQLLTFKAACASHLYDEKFEYAASVYNILEEENDTGRLSFLQMHFGRSIKLLGNLNRTA